VWSDHRRARDVALAAGAVQVGWIAVQPSVIGYSRRLR
jgi:hypothetical protein